MLLPRRTFATNQSLTIIAIAVPVASLLLLSVAIMLILRCLRISRSRSRGQYSGLHNNEQTGSKPVKRMSMLTSSTDLSRTSSIKSMSDLEGQLSTEHQLPILPQYSSLNLSLATEKPIIVEPHPAARDPMQLRRNQSMSSEYSIQCNRRLSVRGCQMVDREDTVLPIVRGPSTRVASFHSVEEYSQLIEDDVEGQRQHIELPPPIPRKSSRRDSTPSVIAEVLANALKQ